MKQLSRFDKIVVGILLAVALAIGLVIWRGNQVGAQISGTFPQAGKGISAWGRVGISFGQPMRTDTVNSLFKIEPAVPGQMQWDGNTLWYVPAQPFEPGATYHLLLQPGGYASDGRQVKQKLDVVFTIRRPQNSLHLSQNQPKRAVGHLTGGWSGPSAHLHRR